MSAETELRAALEEAEFRIKLAEDEATRLRMERKALYHDHPDLIFSSDTLAKERNEARRKELEAKSEAGNLQLALADLLVMIESVRPDWSGFDKSTDNGDWSAKGIILRAQNILKNAPQHSAAAPAQGERLREVLTFLKATTEALDMVRREAELIDETSDEVESLIDHARAVLSATQLAAAPAPSLAQAERAVVDAARWLLERARPHYYYAAGRDWEETRVKNDAEKAGTS